ncbi:MULTISPECIES: aminoacyl-tRNA hydrolase [Shouchella]|uniref:Peptidyl-tRNA hydrolase n=2 Tax=Shouchella TaxID=2893057 RepID=PTH_SHOC1|nr:aminoacyl-tRNA hydrolase [Shouchella clausii]Q5WAD6.1 RecName: Full=Peptidyl-tRNA hydrolase; Short=PTH [Shouchella clausii KSM-K16]MCM3314702.1 aminoacyl-tRNA hydrolase [Psychrobacillus sp. MER TA 17]BAD62624.1 peptidyl-tRNA hydrolase stage V sporulation protein C [Shouchella clausii KSM-K16]
MKLVVGLGNPGKKYEHTRHNIGFDIIDRCAQKLDLPLDKQKFKAIYGEKRIGSEKVVLLKPLTYMNLSGEAVRPFMDYFNISNDELVVIYDDLDLPVGKIRLRKKGSAGGHNGIKSLIAHLGTEDFNRIRVGIGRPAHGEPVVHYVLDTYRKEELAFMNEAAEKSAKAIEAWLEKPFLEVMNTFN